MKKVILVALVVFFTILLASCSHRYNSGYFHHGNNYNSNVLLVYSYNKPFLYGYTEFFVIEGNIFKEISIKEGKLVSERMFLIKERNDTSFLRPLYEIQGQPDNKYIIKEMDSVRLFVSVPALNKENRLIVRDTVLNDYFIKKGNKIIYRRPIEDESIPYFP